MKIAVTGANSSVGLELLARLRERDDVEAVACVRSERAAAEIPASPRARVRIASYEDRAALTEALAGAECVVHLAGILIEGRGTSYESANVETAVAVAEAAARAGVEHLVLVSVVGADPASANRYFRTKGLAERAFAESGVPVTIVRTPILLGPGTAGAFSLARTVRRRHARLLGGGHYTMRPLDVDDLGEAIVRICRTRAEGVVFISGDVHWGEISALRAPDMYPLYDVTSSGINQEWPTVEPNRNRVGEVVRDYNFGMIEVDWGAEDPPVQLRVHDVTGRARVAHTVRLSELGFGE